MTTLRFLRVQWDRVGAVVAAVVGIVMLGIGYAGVKDTAFIAGQVPYILSAGFGSIIALTIAAALWVSADMRDEWQELVDQGEELRQENAERSTDLQAAVQAEVARLMQGQTSSGGSDLSR